MLKILAGLASVGITLGLGLKLWHLWNEAGVTPGDTEFSSEWLPIRSGPQFQSYLTQNVA